MLGRIADQIGKRGVAGVAAAGATALVIAAFVVLGSFKAVAPSDVCVVQEGGPLDGRGIAEVQSVVAANRPRNHICRVIHGRVLKGTTMPQNQPGHIARRLLRAAAIIISVAL